MKFVACGCCNMGDSFVRNETVSDSNISSSTARFYHILESSLKASNDHGMQSYMRLIERIMMKTSTPGYFFGVHFFLTSIAT